MIIPLAGKDSCLDTMMASLSVKVLSSKIIPKYLTITMKFRDEIDISDNELYNRNSVMQNLFNNSAEYNNM